MEIIFEIIFDGIVEIVKNKKINKLIRYPLLLLISLFYLFIILLFIYLGFVLIKKSFLITLFMFGIAILLITFIYKFYVLIFEEEKK